MQVAKQRVNRQQVAPPKSKTKQKVKLYSNQRNVETTKTTCSMPSETRRNSGSGDLMIDMSSGNACNAAAKPPIESVPLTLIPVSTNISEKNMSRELSRLGIAAASSSRRRCVALLFVVDDDDDVVAFVVACVGKFDFGC